MSRKQREKRSRAKSYARAPTETPSAPNREQSAPPAEKANASINKLGLIVAVAGIAGLFGLVVFLGEGPPPASTSATESSEPEAEAEPEEPPVERWQAALLQEVPIDPGRDFARGPEDARVSIVEFTDFECPFCKNAHTSLTEVLERYPSDVRLVYKNFPLDMACNDDMAQQLHPFACKAAVMARCAGAKNPELFWRFHDAIFEVDGFNDEWLDATATELGLTGESFGRCVSGRDAFDEVRADIELARSLGVNATPTVYVNGRVAPSYETGALVEIIDHIINQ